MTNIIFVTLKGDSIQISPISSSILERGTKASRSTMAGRSWSRESGALRNRVAAWLDPLWSSGRGSAGRLRRPSSYQALDQTRPVYC